jgi:hypothetical protein
MKYILIFLIFAGSLRAENIAEFLGEGEVKAAADYVSLSIGVHADCQLTPEEAQKAGDQVAVQINKYLEKLKKASDPNFKIIIDGGYTSSYQRYFENKTLCDKTLQKNTNITLHISPGEDFSKVFSDIQGYVLGQFNQESFLGQPVARTYVTVQMPEPRLTDEHQKSLSKSLLDLAFKNAKENFIAATKSCKLKYWQVKSMKEANSSEPAPMPVMFKASRFQAGSANEPAPVKFDDLKLRRTLLVGFSLDGLECL